MKLVGIILAVVGLGAAAVLLYLHFEARSVQQTNARKAAHYQRRVAAYKRHVSARREKAARDTQAADRAASACRTAAAQLGATATLAVFTGATKAGLQKAPRTIISACGRPSNALVVLGGKRRLVYRDVRKLGGRPRRVRRLGKKSRHWLFRSGAKAVLYSRWSPALIERALVAPIRRDLLPRRVVLPPAPPPPRMVPASKRRHDILAYILGGTLVPLGILLWLLSRRPTRAELTAIFEASSQLKNKADVALQRLEQSHATGDFDERLARLHADIAAAVDERQRQVVARAKEESSAGFTLAAVKAVVPCEKWRQEFKQRATEATERAIDGRQLVQQIANATSRETAAFREHVAPPASITLSESGRRGLQRLAGRNDRLMRFLAGDETLAPLLQQRAQLADDIAVGGRVVAGGAAIALFPVAIGFEVAGEVASHLLGEYLESEVICDIIVNEVGEMLVEHVGEEALSEVVEAVGLALTGIGAIWTAYKLVKYGALIKRLHGSVRDQLTDRAQETLNQISTNAARRADRAMRSLFGSLSHSLTELRTSAARREAWAHKRLT